MINFLEYWEITPEKTLHFSWVTDFTITKDNAYELMRGGRTRWKVENETFNTLKTRDIISDITTGSGRKI